MKYLQFIDFNDYPIKDRKTLEKSLISFFNSPRICGYIHAFTRRASNEQTSQIKQAIKALCDAIIEGQKKKDCKQFMQWMGMWEELSTPPSKRLNNKDLENKFLPLFYDISIKMLLSEKRETTEQIEQFVILGGKQALDIEETNALSKLKDKELVKFDEYLSVLFEEATNSRSQYCVSTQLQWISYLRYVKNKILPFANAAYYSENIRQANLLIDKIDQVISIITGEIENFNAMLDSYCKNKTQVEENIEENCQLKAILALRETGNTDYSLETVHKNDLTIEAIRNRLQTLADNYSVLKKDEVKISEFIKQKSGLFLDENRCFDKEADVYKSCQGFLSYWFTNLPRIKNRQDDIKAIEVFADNKETGKEDVIYRYVSEVELADLKRNKQFLQAPNVCLEREKWFYEAGANLGNGVTHEYNCKIYLKAGTLELLKQIIKPDNQFAAIVSKINESHCFGVHEDALPQFNKLVTRVSVTSKGSVRPSCQIEFLSTAKNQRSLTYCFSQIQMTMHTGKSHKTNKSKKRVK